MLSVDYIGGEDALSKLFSDLEASMTDRFTIVRVNRISFTVLAIKATDCSSSPQTSVKVPT